MSKNSKNNGKSFECPKRAREPLQHEIDVEKWFSNGYSD